MSDSNFTATIWVPGTTSNFGPGFDCLGAALTVANQVSVWWQDEPRSHPPIVQSAAELYFRQPEVPPTSRRGFGWSITGSVPRSRGLGSSVTVRLGILGGLNLMLGNLLSRQRLFELCAELEGHPDNAGPAVFGGFFVGTPQGQFQRTEVSEELGFAVLVRHHEVLTEWARRVLPREVPFADAVRNVAMSGGIIAAFFARDYDSLRGLFVDSLHEPYRQELNPGFAEIRAAGERAGAYGGFLSGSGSSVICVARQEKIEGVGTAMVEACADEIRPSLHLLRVDNEGMRTSMEDNA